jgi:hypothetical protein
MKLKTGLRIHVVLAVAALVLFLVTFFLARGSPRLSGVGIAAAFGLSGLAFLLNGRLGVIHDKMHMQIGTVVSRLSRGDKMFKFDLIIQFAGAVLSLGLACWFLIKALR